MKDTQKTALVKYRLEQADETLRDSRLLLRAGSFRSAINRAYYAMFYSVLALLVTRDKGTSKHSGAIALFDQEFVKHGLFDAELSRWLHRALDRRQEADYKEMAAPSVNEVAEVLERAEQFVARITDRLSSWTEPGGTSSGTGTGQVREARVAYRTKARGTRQQAKGQGCGQRDHADNLHR